MNQNIFLEEYFKIILYLYKLKVMSGTTRINSWKSNGILEKNIDHHLLIIIDYQT